MSTLMLQQQQLLHAMHAPLHRPIWEDCLSKLSSIFEMVTKNGNKSDHNVQALRHACYYDKYRAALWQ